MLAMPLRSEQPAVGVLGTPLGAVKLYLHALGSGECDLAFKISREPAQSMRAFRQSCQGIAALIVESLHDPNYRIRAQTAMYTCVAVRYTIVRSTGWTNYGGGLLMERTLGPAWHPLITHSDLHANGSAVTLSKAACAERLPSYVRPGAGTIITGYDAASRTAAVIATSTSGSYLPHGSCTHGIGTNCNTASTVVARTLDGGRHWTRILHITSAIGPGVWIRRFDARHMLVAATVGESQARGVDTFRSRLFATADGGRHWRASTLPPGYATEPGTMSFPDARHGWLWFGGGAMGSMSVYLYRTEDGGAHWRRVACTAFSNPTPGYGCPHLSGISLGGDKQYLTFRNRLHGWLTSLSPSGNSVLYATVDGGARWHPQVMSLPSAAPRPARTVTLAPPGQFLQPSFVGDTGIELETGARVRVWRSTDGGSSWQQLPVTPITGNVACWSAIDARHWSVVSGPTLWTTGNGGTTWTEHSLHLPAHVTLVSLAMSTPSNGWAIAQRPGDSEVSAFGSRLLRTSSGGEHWRVLSLPGA
jgi:photosystem II stability/assembly factor-like uncharacterized protein